MSGLCVAISSIMWAGATWIIYNGKSPKAPAAAAAMLMVGAVVLVVVACLNQVLNAKEGEADG